MTLDSSSSSKGIFKQGLWSTLLSEGEGGGGAADDKGVIVLKVGASGGMLPWQNCEVPYGWKCILEN